MLQPKRSEEIRRDALRLARAKIDGGCYGCAESYLITARIHGASDGEIVPLLRDLLMCGAVLGQTGRAALAASLGIISSGAGITVPEMET